VHTFVGRDAEIKTFCHVLEGTLSHRVLNVTGIAGVGKSTLIERFLEIADEAKLPIGLVNARRLAGPVLDQRYHPVIDALSALESSFAGYDWQLPQLDRRLRQYTRLHGRLVSKFGGQEADVGAVLKIGIMAIRAGSSVLPFTRSLDSELTQQVVTQVSKAIADHRRETDRALLLHPLEQLTTALVGDLNALVSEGNWPVVLFVDEFELVPPEVEAWLLRLFSDAYGPLDRNVLLVLAGRLRLGQDWTARGQNGGPRDIKSLPLEAFTRDEMVDYLRAALAGGAEPERTERLADRLGEACRLPLLLRLLVTEPRISVLEDLSAQFELGRLASELVDRTLGGQLPGDGVAERRELALAVAVARSFDLPVVEALTASAGIADPRGAYGWLEQQHFINPQAPPYAYYDLVREVFLARLRSSNPQLHERLHLALVGYFERAAAAEGSSARARKLSVELAYHRLSVAGSDLLVCALNALFQVLPNAFHHTLDCAEMLRQVLAERTDLSERDRQQLHRLATVVSESWRLSKWEHAVGGQQTFDPALNVFFTSFYDGQPPSATAADAELWLGYFESRVRITAGGADALDKATSDLLTIWRAVHDANDAADRPQLLAFCVAVDLAEAHTRRGDVAIAISWSRHALRLARKDGAPLRQAVALYLLSANQKRRGEYRLALANLDAAIEVFGKTARYASDYYLGRLMLDKANTHTYLNEYRAAEEAFEASRAYFQDVSPQSFAELSHRLGWLKRVRGELDEALADHVAAAHQFRVLESGILSRNAVEASSIPFLRAKALHSTGNVLAEMCRHPEALECYDDALALFGEQGARRHEAITRKDRAWSRYQRAGLADATADLAAALASLGDNGGRREKSASHSRTHLTEAWLLLSLIYTCAGQAAAAAAPLAEAEALLAGDSDNRQLVARAALVRAALAALRGEADVLAAALAPVESYADGSDPPQWLLAAQAAVVRAVAAQAAGDGPAAADWLGQARARAARWNRYAVSAVDELWAQLSRSAARPPAGAVAVVPARPGAGPIAPLTGRPEEDLIDIYDSHGEPLGRATTHLAHVTGLWHRTFHCWLGDRSADGTNTVLLQQRGPYKRDFPDFLDISAAGHYHAGEGVEGGLREFREELGAVLDPAELRLMAVRVVDEDLKNGVINREFQDIYAARRPISLAALSPGYPEVAGLYECDLDGVLDLLDGRAEAVRCAGVAVLDDRLQAVEKVATIADFIPSARHYLRTVLTALRDLLERGAVGAVGAEPVPAAEAVLLADGSTWRPVR
jgi:tetratricopeptide (TPR) repeat protein/isopentenyldiphosphate isomerase